MGLRQYMTQPMASRTQQQWGKTWNPQLSDETGRRQLHATDVEFSMPTREASRMNLQRAMSVANPEDYSDLESLRGAYRGQLERQGGAAGVAGSALDTDMQRGLANMLSQYKRSRAGTGALNSPQYDRGLGDIMSRSNEAYVRGLNELENANLGRLGSIQQGFGNIYRQDLTERQDQFNQAKSLSDLLQRQIDADEARSGGLRGAEQAQKNADRAFYSDLINKVAAGGAMLATGGAAAPAVMPMLGGQSLGGMGYADPNYWNQQVYSSLGTR